MSKFLLLSTSGAFFWHTFCYCTIGIHVGGVGWGTPPVKKILLTPCLENGRKFGNKTEEFIDPPQNFKVRMHYAINLILYVVTNNFYDPPREILTMNTYDV